MLAGAIQKVPRLTVADFPSLTEYDVCSSFEAHGENANMHLQAVTIRV